MKMVYFKKRLVAGALVCAMAVGMLHGGTASATRSIEDIEKDKKDLQQEINALDSELVDLLAEIDTLTAEISSNEAEIEDLKAMGITALAFPCIRIAQNGKSAKGMWMADTAEGQKPIAAEFLNWGDEWKLWKLILDPTTENLPAEPYDRCYPDPIQKPQERPAFGGPGGPPPMGGPGGPAPEGPGGPPPMDGPGGPPMDGPDRKSVV